MALRRNLLNESSESFSEKILLEMRDFMSSLDRGEAESLLIHIQKGVDAERERLLEVESVYRHALDEIAAAEGYQRLGEIHRRLNQLEIERFLSLPSVPALHKSCTCYRDRFAERALHLVEQELAGEGKGPAPLPYALISMGSDGREEQTLITDQDYLLVYGNGGRAEDDCYFELFTQRLVDRLETIGFEKCPGEIMPSNPVWRGSVHQWERRILSIVRYESADYAKNMMDLIILSDARYVAGERTMADALVELIHDFERNYFQVLWGMAKAATEMQVGLGWFGRIWTDRKGEHQGLFNVKLFGWAPLVMNIRILAVHCGINETNTLRRIDRLEEERSLSPESSAALRSAYLLLTRYRVEVQIRVLKGEQSSSHYLDPRELTAKQTDALRNALRRIEDLQKIIRTNFTIL